MDTGTANQLACDAICHAASQTAYAFQTAASMMERPSVLYRPTLSLDGDMYCALLGSNLVEGCAGFGKTVAEAMSDFDNNFHKLEAPTSKPEDDPIQGIRDDLKEIMKGTSND